MHLREFDTQGPFVVGHFSSHSLAHTCQLVLWVVAVARESTLDRWVAATSRVCSPTVNERQRWTRWQHSQQQQVGAALNTSPGYRSYSGGPAARCGGHEQVWSFSPWRGRGVSAGMARNAQLHAAWLVSQEQVASLSSAEQQQLTQHTPVI